MKNKATLEEKYADVLAQINELEELKQVLNQEIVEKMNKQGITNEKTEKGNFLLAWRKSWEYSSDTEMLAVKLKEAKKREENNGTAKIKDQTEYLRFIPAKGTNE